MKIQQKIGGLFALGIAVYLVNQTGSERRMINGGTFGDQARRYLYGMAGASALGLVFCKDKEGER